MERIVIKCKGACGQDVNSAEVDVDGVCALCAIMVKVSGDYEEYKRLWRKHQRYEAGGHPHQATDEQLGRVVGRIAAKCHAKLPPNGAISLVNEICERARAEIEGYKRLLTVDQVMAQAKAEKPRARSQEGRKSAGGVYLPG